MENYSLMSQTGKACDWKCFNVYSTRRIPRVLPMTHIVYQKSNFHRMNEPIFLADLVRN